MRRIAIALLTCFVLAGCTSETKDATPSAAPSPSAQQSGGQKPGGPPENPTADFATIFTADPTIVNAHPIPFQSWTRTGPDGDHIAVHFTVGSPDCYGVDATATETAKSVTIELRSGTKPDAVGKMCTMIAVFGSLDVPLKAPLGDRQVVSAA